MTPEPEPTAEPTQPPVSSVVIDVLYQDEAAQPVADAEKLELQPGEWPVSANPVNLQPGYLLVGADTVTVTVNQDGANPNPVVFTYRYEQMVAPPVDVPVYFVTEDGQPVATAKTFTLQDGTNTVEAQPDDLMEGYELVGDQVQYIIYTLQQPAPDAIRFVYRQAAAQPTAVPEETPTPAPSPKVALVPVKYLAQDGTELYVDKVSVTEGQPVQVHVDFTLLREPDRYQLDDEQQKTVSVDANGVATPEAVIFTFIDMRPDVSATVTLRYQTQDGKVLADPTTATVTRLGQNEVVPQPVGLTEGYELLSEVPQIVNLSDQGVPTPSEVIFLYQPLATATPGQPTESPYIITAMENAYAYPYSDTVKFRTEPRIQDNNIIATVTRQDLVKILGKTENELRELWYYAEINGQKGFIKDSVVNRLTPEQVNELLGITPAPTASRPQPHHDPEGVPIDLWGEANKDRVNYRSAPDATSSKTFLGRVNTGDKVWVEGQELAGNELWYTVKINGTSAYVMAKYVTLYSQEESDRYQASLPSPAPVRTATPAPATATPEPATATPQPATEAPAPATATPHPATPAPTPTPEPAQYKGFALTTKQTALRSGANTSDETILATLPINTLVRVWGQTYVSGVAWNHVDAISQAQSGYLPDSALRRIDNAEANIYLEQMQPKATPTPAPTAVPAKQAGYARTLGDNVPMRSHYDTNAQIVSILPASTTLFVVGQEYNNGETWHMVQHAGQYGYIRADQLKISPRRRPPSI